MAVETDSQGILCSYQYHTPRCLPSPLCVQQEVVFLKKLPPLLLLLAVYSHHCLCKILSYLHLPETFRNVSKLSGTLVDQAVIVRLCIPPLETVREHPVVPLPRTVLSDAHHVSNSARISTMHHPIQVYSSSCQAHGLKL